MEDFVTRVKEVLSLEDPQLHFRMHRGVPIMFGVIMETAEKSRSMFKSVSKKLGANGRFEGIVELKTGIFLSEMTERTHILGFNIHSVLTDGINSELLNLAVPRMRSRFEGCHPAPEVFTTGG